MNQMVQRATSRVRSFWDDYKELLGDVLLISCGLFYLYMFIFFLRGGHFAYESSKVIATTEAIVSGIIVWLGAERAIKDWRAAGRSRKKRSRQNQNRKGS